MGVRVCVCVCVYAGARQERERERETARERGEKESKSIVGIHIVFPIGLLLVNICIVMYVQLRPPTLSLASASQFAIRGTGIVLRVYACVMPLMCAFVCVRVYNMFFIQFTVKRAR